LRDKEAMMTMTFRRHDRATLAVSPSRLAYRPRPTPAGTKIMLVLVAINVFVALVVLVKLSAPHLG
jgi:hypothetical protein